MTLRSLLELDAASYQDSVSPTLWTSSDAPEAFRLQDLRVRAAWLHQESSLTLVPSDYDSSTSHFSGEVEGQLRFASHRWPRLHTIVKTIFNGTVLSTISPLRRLRATTPTFPATTFWTYNP